MVLGHERRRKIFQAAGSKDREKIEENNIETKEKARQRQQDPGSQVTSETSSPLVSLGQLSLQSGSLEGDVGVDGRRSGCWGIRGTSLWPWTLPLGWVGNHYTLHISVLLLDYKLKVVFYC